MNYLEPFRGDLGVIHDGATYTLGYYARPLSVSGVVDETYPEYDPIVTYGVGDFIVLSSLQGVYRSSAADNTGNFPPANPNVWTFWGPINSHKMLAVDEFIGATTTGIDCVFEFDFPRATAFSFIGSSFVTVAVRQIDNITDEVLWEETIQGSTIGASSYFEYFYGAVTKTTRVYRDGLIWSLNSRLIFTFSGEVEIGALVIGLVTPFGCTLRGTNLRFEESSSITRSEVTGFRTVTRYGNVRILTVNILFDTADFNILAQKVEAIIGKSILFVPDGNDQFSEMITIGYFETFDIPVENPLAIQTQSNIIGII